MDGEGQVDPELRVLVPRDIGPALSHTIRDLVQGLKTFKLATLLLDVYILKRYNI